MADQKVSQLTDASTPLDGSELLYMVQGGQQRKGTAQDVANLAAPEAIGVTYDNTSSGIAAVNVQDAIDEIKDLIPGTVVDNAPTIAQTLWHEAAQITSNDVGFNFQQSGYSASLTNNNLSEFSLTAVTGAGTTANIWARRSNTPTFDMRLGAPAYSSRSRAAWVISKPQAGVFANITAGASPSNTFATLPATLFGYEKSTSDVHRIVMRVSSTDLATPVTLSVSEGQRLIVCVEITGNGSNAIIGAKVGVFDFLTGALIGKLTWTGSNAVTGLNWEVWTSRPTAPPAIEDTLRIFYQAYGPVPSPTLNPFFLQL